MIKNPKEKLRGKTVWITGGKRIGQTIAEEFAKLGVNIVVSFRSSSKEADEIVERAKKIGVDALSVKCDVSRKESVIEAVEDVRKKFPQIDILVNLASVFTPVQFRDISEKDWEQNISAHILGTFWPSQKISEIMPNGGHIINIADRTTLGKPYSGYLPYVVTKGAIGTMTKALAGELASKGIFVNAIAPGPILRPDDISIEEWQKIRETSALKYTLTDDEAVSQFAKLVLYLSEVTMASGYVYPLDQGQNL
jgi:NAD(P)-dependent dehydrogenase (short-subunit alcohol dehydrogenase family)